MFTLFAVMFILPVALIFYFKDLLWPWTGGLLFRYRMLPPGQGRELAKAGNGAGLIAYVWVLVSLLTPHLVMEFPVWWAPLAAVSVWGAVWLLTSGAAVRLYGSQGPLDVNAMFFAAVKIAIGGAALAYLPYPLSFMLQVVFDLSMFNVSPPGYALFVLMTIGWFVALWLVVANATRLLLLLSTKIRLRRRKAPQPFEAPRGAARNATLAEAREAMAGKGGTASALDREKF